MLLARYAYWLTKKRWDLKLDAYWSGMLIYRMLIARFYCKRLDGKAPNRATPPVPMT